MTDISDLERRMLECDKHCADHHTTVDSVAELKQCSIFTKNKVESLSNKVSWLMGLTFFAAMMMGYCLNSMTHLTDIARRQESKNQSYSENVVKGEQLVTSQKALEISVAVIQKDLSYMKQDINAIKKNLEMKNLEVKN